MQRILYIGNDLDSIRIPINALAQNIHIIDGSPTLALEDILRLNPDGMILDLNLTYRVARNLFRTIRETEALREMPVLVISREEFIEAWLPSFASLTGHEDYIVFSFSSDEMIERLMYLLKSSS